MDGSKALYETYGHHFDHVSLLFVLPCPRVETHVCKGGSRGPPSQITLSFVAAPRRSRQDNGEDQLGVTYERNRRLEKKRDNIWARYKSRSAERWLTHPFP